jgi:hypothetical protein
MLGHAIIRNYLRWVTPTEALRSLELKEAKMSGILSIKKGTPHWWLSPDIWVTPVGDPTTPPGVANPIAGKAYNVSVNVHDNYTDPVDSGWNLFVCWAIPTAGPIPVPTAASGQILNNAAITVPVPAMSLVTLQTAMTWTPTFANGGHECLIAMAYNEQAIGFPGGPLNGDAPDTAASSIAQHNLGVLPVGSHMSRRFQYAFQVCNGAGQERGFVVGARQAPLSEIVDFLPGVPGGRTVIDKPGKVEHLGIVASAQPNPAELEAAPAVLPSVKVAPHSCRAFTLSGSLQKGNALIHVTQSLDEWVVGGLSVLVMTEEK